MAKEDRPIISDKMVGEIVTTIKEVSEKAIESNEKTRIEKETARIELERSEKEKFKKQEEAMKTEFDRVFKLLIAATPGTEAYHNLLDNLNDIKRIIKSDY